MCRCKQERVTFNREKTLLYRNSIQVAASSWCRDICVTFSDCMEFTEQGIPIVAIHRNTFDWLKCVQKARHSLLAYNHLVIPSIVARVCRVQVE